MLGYCKIYILRLERYEGWLAQAEIPVEQYWAGSFKSKGGAYEALESAIDTKIIPVVTFLTPLIEHNSKLKDR